ncbi:MAG TPA: preprotein translocase subunit SecG [archaeon]|nr:preprotein translocase subunit SecG [archaeon]
MLTVLLILHIFISFLLVVVILLQAGKGGGLASAFGGSGTTDAVFGGRHAATFLGKATTVLGTIFLVSSFVLALLFSYSSGPRSVVQENLTGKPMPVAPAPVAQPAGEDLFQGEKSQAAPAENQPSQNK